MFGNLSSGEMPEVFFGVLPLIHGWASSAHTFQFWMSYLVGG